MSSTLLEHARLSHEIVEKYELAVSDILEEAPNGVRNINNSFMAWQFNLLITFSKKQKCGSSTK